MQETAPTRSDERSWGVASHLSGLICYVSGIPMAVGPFLVYLLKKNDSPFIAEHAKESLNFNLSALIYLVLFATSAGLFTVLTLGLGVLVLLPGLLLGVAAHIIFTISAAIKASNGHSYRYPLTIRFVK